MTPATLIFVYKGLIPHTEIRSISTTHTKTKLISMLTLKPSDLRPAYKNQVNFHHLRKNQVNRSTALKTSQFRPAQSISTPMNALVRWAAGERLPNRLPTLSLITLSPPLNSGILGLRMGPHVPTPKFFYNLWGPRESDSSDY